MMAEFLILFLIVKLHLIELKCVLSNVHPRINAEQTGCA